MKHTMSRALLGTSIALLAQFASAATVNLTPSPGGEGVIFQSGTATLDFGEDAVSAIEGIGGTPTAYGSLDPQPMYTTDSDGFSRISFKSGPADSVQMDSDSGQLTGMSFDGSGFTITRQLRGGLTANMVIGNLRLDAATGEVHGKIDAAGDVGTLADVIIWTAGATTASSTLIEHDVCLNLGGCDQLGSAPHKDIIGVQGQLSNLHLTEQGIDIFTRSLSLGLSPAVRAALQNINDFGTLTFHAQFAVPVGSTITAVVPEPSTYALMGLGLIGLFGLQRRQSI